MDKKNCLACIGGPPEGYQLKGTVTFETSGKRYEETARWVEEFGNRVGFILKSKGAVILKIGEIYGVSP